MDSQDEADKQGVALFGLQNETVTTPNTKRSMDTKKGVKDNKIVNL
jgi:hypothetical protein